MEQILNICINYAKEANYTYWGLTKHSIPFSAERLLVIYVAVS